MMKVIIHFRRFIVLVVFTGVVLAGDAAYRLAGIIAPADTRWMAVIELPNSKQQLVYEGETVGEAKVLRISQREVLLELKGVIHLLQLDSSESEQQSRDAAVMGIPAHELLEQIRGTPELADSGELPGLVDMDHVPGDVRIVSINGKSVASPGEGLQILQDAISKGSLIRLKLEEGATLPIIYLKPGTDVGNNEAM